MNPILTSRIAPVVGELGIQGALEGAHLLRLILQKKSNPEIRKTMARLFGSHWSNRNHEKKYFAFLSSYVLRHHEREFFAYLRATDPEDRADQMKILRPHLVRYLAEMQGLRETSEVVNDLA